MSEPTEKNLHPISSFFRYHIKEPRNNNEKAKNEHQAKETCQYIILNASGPRAVFSSTVGAQRKPSKIEIEAPNNPNIINTMDVVLAPGMSQPAKYRS
tara:strand:- start:133 stop:426 length:294 start_codon:yes stop_codon:yes gene_type:complete